MKNELVVREYLRGVQSSAVRLAIVGKDPFPKSATGIPFCKPSWSEQRANNCSGRVVLESLGIDLDTAQEAFASPQRLFESLREQGVVVLNSCYDHVAKSVKKEQLIAQMRAAFKLNRPVLESATDILLCGEAWKLCWLPEFDGHAAVRVVHPDIRNSWSRYREVRWQWGCWWSKNGLVKKFDLELALHDCG